MARDVRHDRDHDEYAGVYVWITDDIRGLIALGCNGGAFAGHAASKLLSIRKCYTSTRYYMLISALNRGDNRCAAMYLDDWVKQDHMPKATVSKFVPGDHYHVFGTKFDTLEEAQRHLWTKGYTFGGLVEKHVYNRDGD